MINSLPDDLLCDIFLTNTHSDLDAPHDPSETLVSVSRVCRRWHDIALNYSLLWSRIIDFENQDPAWISVLLNRSKAADIYVGGESKFQAARLNKARSKLVLETIFEHRLRIKTLNLSIRLAPWDLICRTFLSHPAPNLEFVNLITSCPFPDCLYPGDLFANQASNLKKFNLQRCLVDFSSPTLYNLTEFSVIDIITPGILGNKPLDHPLKMAPTPTGWLRILENMTSLRYLTLSNAVSVPKTDESDLTIKVDLPNLQLLSLYSRFQDGVIILENLNIPSTCGIRMRLNCTAPPGADGHKLMDTLERQLAHWPKASPNRYIQAKILSGDRIHFGNTRRVGFLWDTTDADLLAEHASHTPDPLLWLVLIFDSSEDALGYFSPLLSLYQRTYATTTNLDLWIDEEFTTLQPTLELAPFTAVTSLSLVERSPLYLLPLFQYSSIANYPLFPSLKTLHFQRTEFEDETCATFQAVLAFLLWRTQVNAPLEELWIYHSKMNDDTLESLRQKGNVKVSKGKLKLHPTLVA